MRVAFFGCLFLVYFTLFPYNRGLNNPNENARIYTTMALVDHHTWKIDAEVERFGKINDNAIIGDHEYAAKAPGTSLLGAPIYWLFSKVAPAFIDRQNADAWIMAATVALRLVVIQLPCFLFLLWFERSLRTRCNDEVLRLTATAALAVGTNFLAYSLMFVSHSLCAIAAFMAFCFIGERRRPFAAAILAGLVTLLEYQGAMLSLVLGVYALVSYPNRRSRLLFVGGAVLCAAALLGFQQAAFGSALRTPFAYLADEKLRAGHVRGFLGLGLPQATALWSLCFDRTVGLFGTSPFLWLLVPAFVVARKQREARWAFAICVILLFTMSGITNWRAGWSIGPRYLVPIMPFAVFIIANGLARMVDYGRNALEITRGVAGGLAVASALSVGLVSIVINTLPYDITHPLGQVAIPFLRAGFVPYHVGDLVGWHSPVFSYIAVAALMLATVVPLLVGVREGWLRWPVVVIVCAIGVAPMLPTESTECPRGVRRLSEIWEPQGRDRIRRLRTAAAANPCEWRKVARLERALCWQGAEDDARRAEDLDCRNK